VKVERLILEIEDDLGIDGSGAVTSRHGPDL